MLGTLIGAWLGGLANPVIQLMVFGGVLMAAAYVLFRNRAPREDAIENSESDTRTRSPVWKIAIEGATVGIVTGFVGVGGGFLIVPALVVFGRLPMRLAIGTSLAITALKAAVGFAKYQQHLMAQDMSVSAQTVLIFVLVGAVGSVVGRYVNSHMNQRLLKKVFAGFLVLLGGFVIVHEGSKLVLASDQPSSAQADAGIPLNRSALPHPIR